MKIKEGIGWKACHNEEKDVYGAEVVFQGSWELYEITADVFNRLDSKMSGGEAERLLAGGRRLYMHVNDRCGPPYTVVLDDDYMDYCQWMRKSEPVGKTWDKPLTEAAKKVFGIENKKKKKK